MKTKINILRTCLFLMLIPMTSSGQDEVRILEDIDPLFQQAVDHYASGRYKQAIEGFDRLINHFPLHQRTTASHVMKAKAQLAAGASLDAARTIRGFLSSYPKSRYRSDAEYTLGLAYVRAGRLESATGSFLDAWAHIERGVRPGRLEADIVEALDGVIDSAYNVAQLGQLINEAGTSTQRAFLWLKLAERHVNDAQIRQAETALDTIDLYYPGTFPTRVAEVRARARQRGDVTIGVLLPLMKSAPGSQVGAFGNEILQGIQFAVDRHNSEPGVRVQVNLDVRDTERDPLVATRAAQELTSDDDILVILGPTFSNTTSAVVGLASARHVPLITPTANSNGIAAVGPYIFQANPDYETRGRAMARFAIGKKGFKRFAVLAPIDTHSKYMAESFIAEVQRLGGEVMATEWYQRGETDFSMQLKSIRRTAMMDASVPMISFTGTLTRQEIAALVHLGVPMSRIDSLLERSATVEAEKLLGPDARRLLDSLNVDTMLDESLVDSLEYPVLGIDGFYLPVSMPEEIGVVSSQIVYFNFETQMLGSGEWNNFSQLDANKRYCANIIFESDTYVDAADPRYGTFVDAFFQKHRTKPTNNVLFGYDTAEMVLEHIRAGASHRSTLLRALGQTSEFQGFHSKIGFSSGRVNHWLQILQFDGERIHRIEELNAK